MSHKDFFGRSIDVGDIVLSAKAGGKFFETNYTFSVVVAATPKLLRVHQLSSCLECLTYSQDKIKEELSKRYGRKAGKVNPSCLIKTDVNVGLTTPQMQEAIDRVPPSTLNPLAFSFP